MMQKHTLQPKKKMKRDFLFIYMLGKQEKENTDKQKTKKNNSGLKHRSQRIISNNHTKAIEKTMTLTLV